ncbi:hypothetical protein M5689_006799 [Euphorbia peplus]|nr:hypothetical protein M5689_006799 [Euphorbia peplus]
MSIGGGETEGQQNEIQQPHHDTEDETMLNNPGFHDETETVFDDLGSQHDQQDQQSDGTAHDETETMLVTLK